VFPDVRNVPLLKPDDTECQSPVPVKTRQVVENGIVPPTESVNWATKYPLRAGAAECMSECTAGTGAPGVFEEDPEQAPRASNAAAPIAAERLRGQTVIVHLRCTLSPGLEAGFS
jgi:hypothetical protein